MKNEKPNTMIVYRPGYEPFETDGIKYVEFSAYQKAVEVLKEADDLILDDNVLGRGVEISMFIHWKRKMKALLQELGEGDAG